MGNKSAAKGNRKRDRIVFAPASEKQRLILTAQEDIVLVGGGAGGGKSSSCLMRNLDTISDPHLKCTIARKSRPELTRQGGLVSESRLFYEPFNGKFNKQNLVWTFPSGAEIQFLGIPDSSMLGGLQGLQASRIFVDEAADDWELDVILFLLSRLRSGAAKHKAQMYMTCNPNPQSFLKEWVDYCLDPETGVPIVGTENIVRWLVVLDGKVLWADSPEESYQKYGIPRGMVYGLGLSAQDMLSVNPEKLFLPKSFRFIPCNVYDNPYLLPPKNTTYLANLLAQPRKNQLKFLHGSWLNIDVGQGNFKREWCEIINPHEIPEDGISWVRAYDLAATPKSEVNRNPDSTVGVLMGRDRVGTYYIVDMCKYQERPHTVLQNMIRQSESDGKHIPILIPKDTGSGGAIAAQHFVSVLSEAGCIVKTEVMSGWSNKLNRGLPFCQVAEAGMVKVVKGEWNEEYFNTMEAFLGTPETIRKIHDDEWDATASGFKFLAKTNILPSFSIPDFSKDSIKIT